MDSPGVTWIHLVSLGFTWSLLDTLGFTWVHFDAFGCARGAEIPLDTLGLVHASLGLTWTHLDSLGVAWIHLDSFTGSQLNSPGLAWTYSGLPVMPRGKGKAS